LQLAKANGSAKFPGAVAVGFGGMGSKAEGPAPAPVGQLGSIRAGRVPAASRCSPLRPGAPVLGMLPAQPKAGAGSSLLAWDLFSISGFCTVEACEIFYISGHFYQDDPENETRSAVGVRICRAMFYIEIQSLCKIPKFKDLDTK